jgi:CTP:molybdopterin cytidylyltransferase MocA
MIGGPATAAIVLAAGEGQRFGSDKLVASLDGRPLLVHVVELARSLGLAPCVVVVRPGSDAATLARTIGAADREGAVEVVENPDASDGIATSVRAGLAHLHAAAAGDVAGAPDAAVVLLGDQPGIDPVVVSELVATVRAHGCAAGARYDDAPGHPVVLPRASWPVLLGLLTGDVGVRAVADAIGLRDVAVSGPSPRDVDHPADLELLRSGRPGERTSQRRAQPAG